MNQETHSFSSSKSNTPIQVTLDDFNISEESFKPMTKGLGFHQEQKKASFKPAAKEIKNLNKEIKAVSLLGPLSKENVAAATKIMPSGLEAFYSAKAAPSVQNSLENDFDLKVEEKETKTNVKIAPASLQFFAWAVDVLVVLSFVAVTGALLVLASGIQMDMLIKIIATRDLVLFGSAIFSIYYLLYFTIMDLSASPGKTIFGLRVLKTDNSNVSVKNTFTRAVISLCSSVALFLPMLLDFQGRLSDTKVVK